MESPDILIAGESLIDYIPVDEKVSTGNDVYNRRAGGAPTNVAVAMGKLNAPPWLWTSVGDDTLGDYLKSTLTENSIPSRFIYQRENTRTGIAIIDEKVEGGFQLYIDDTATVNFNNDDLPKDVFTDLNWVHLGGVLLAKEDSRKAMFDLIDRAVAQNCTVSFDPNTRPSMWSSTDELVNIINQALDSVDVVISHTDDFPHEAFPDNAKDLAEAILDRGASAAFITKGAAGAELMTHADSPWGEHHYQNPGFNVKVKDRTGAGDAFAAAAIIGLREPETSLKETLVLANASGAITTTQTGAIAALPDRAAISTWVQNHSVNPY